MKRRSVFAFWPAVVAIMALSTCTPVKDLDDAASIRAVQVTAVFPPSVITGIVEIGPEEVVIPLIYGKYLFPIAFDFEIATNQKIDKIIGLGHNPVVFNSFDEIHRIDLIALSGVVHSYVFKLQEVPQNDRADIEQFEIKSYTPDSFLFTQTPYLDLINGYVDLFGVSETFPFTIYPIIIPSDGAFLPNNVMPDHFAFSSYDTQCTVQVTAESGKQRVWQIRLRQTPIIHPNEAPNADCKARLSLSAQNIAVTMPEEVKSVEVDTDHTTIKLLINSSDWDAAWEGHLSVQLQPYTQMVGYDAEKPFLIDGMGIQERFYLIDMLEGYGAEWKIESVPWINPDAEIESFEIINYESDFSIMELGTPEIYPALSMIEIPVEKGFDFPLIIDAFRLQISRDAHIEDTFPEKLIFNDFDTKYTVNIKAQNQTVKSWTIALFDARSGSNEARVTGYIIKSYSGTTQTENNLILDPLPLINTADRTITLRILDWANKFPLKVEGHINVSPGAQLVPFSFTTDHELIFNTLDDTCLFSVVSENGEIAQTWRIVLQNDAVNRSCDKEVVDFVSGTPSGGFFFAEKYLEFQKRQITLVVSERALDVPLIIAPRITVSTNARLVDVVSGAQLALSFDQPKVFYVQAEDESRAEWRIVLIYAPQIPNSGFESWGKANNSDMNLLPANGTGWCTANNSALSNTTRVAGYNSPYAVQMQTTLQNMNFVIFKITTVAAASAFVGNFTLKTGVNDVYNPISMTSMGIPFLGNNMPVAFSLDYKYMRGAQMTYTEPNRGSLIPSFKNPVNISGSDAASLRVELFYNPTGPFNYETARDRNEAIAKGEILERNDVPEWTHAYVPIQVVAGKEGLLPTHIVVVLTSSHEGDYFKGAPGSTLTADNFVLLYHKPEEGAKKLD